MLLRGLLIRYRHALHVVSDYGVHANDVCVVLVEYLAGVCCVNLQATQTFKCTPQGRVVLKSGLVHFDGLSSFELSFINLAKQEKTGGTVWYLAEQTLLVVVLL